jgi:cell division protease FtsH
MAMRQSDPPDPAPSPQARLPGGAPGGRRWWTLALVLSGLVFAQYWAAHRTHDDVISYTDFYRLAGDQKVASVELEGREVHGKLKASETVAGKPVTAFETSLPDIEDQTLLPLLRDKGVQVNVHTEDEPLLVRLLISLVPWVLIIGGWLWISRRSQQMLAGGGGPLAMLTKSKARRYSGELVVPVRFDDVAGLGSAKGDLQEIVDFLKDATRVKRLGGHVPRGVLLVGPPGTGKTLLARAVAGEAGVPFFSVTGSEFIELFVGMGAARVRELFADAKKVAPAIVFIDEVDAVGRARGTGLGGGSDEREQTLNQLLAELDGFDRNDLTIVMAATNRPDVLDAALLRPGRFDRRVVVDRPELAARTSILKVHTRDKPLSPDVDLPAIAAMTPGFSGADLANLANEAALHASRRKADAVDASDFYAAYDKIVLGDPRETALSPEEKRRVAIHESGHTVVAYFTPDAEPLDRVSILPRGMALGATHQVPAADRHLLTRSEIDARLRVLMGGTAAEAAFLGDPSSGAEHDLKAATQLAFDMVAHFGMSETVGPMYHQHHTEQAFLGQTVAVEGGTSDATVRAIEEEARRILAAAVEAARQTLTDHKAAYDRLVAALLERETVERAELGTILGAPSAA